MTSRAKWVALFFLVLASACYRPKLGNPGFFCHPTDNPACPIGQSCIDGRCVGTGTEGTVPDSGFISRDMNQDSDMPMPMSTPDLSGDPGPDLSGPPPDLLSCVPTGGSCTPYHNNKNCCSKYCIYSNNTCQ